VTFELPPRSRGAIALVVALAVYYVGSRVVTPAIATAVEPSFPADPGPHLFLQHLLTFSLPTAAICIASWLVLARLGCMPSPRGWLGFGPAPARSLRLGAIVGLVLTALVLVIGVALGEHVRFHPDGWKIAGNVFSNYYEELAYRGLIMIAAWAATRSRVAAVVISSAVFGWSHAHGSHAVPMAIAAGVGGAVFAFVAWRGRGLGGAWTAHQVSDMILDSL